MQVSTFRSKKEDQREHEQETRSQSTRWVGRGLQRQSGGNVFGVLPNCKIMAEEGHELEGKAPALKIRSKIEILVG